MSAAPVPGMAETKPLLVRPQWTRVVLELVNPGVYVFKQETTIIFNALVRLFSALSFRLPPRPDDTRPSCLHGDYARRNIIIRFAGNVWHRKKKLLSPIWGGPFCMYLFFYIRFITTWLYGGKRIGRKWSVMVNKKKIILFFLNFNFFSCIQYCTALSFSMYQCANQRISTNVQ